MNGKYPGDNEGKAQQLRTWLRGLEEQAQTVGSLPVLPRFVQTPTADTLTEALRHAQFVPDMVMITCVPGIGKTTACEEYQRTHSNVWMVTGLPSAASTHALLERVCGVMGITENSANRRTPAIIRRAIGSDGLLIIDEAQQFGMPALEELRGIHDQAKIGVAFVGNPFIHARINGGRDKLAQLSSRVGMRVNRTRALATDVNMLLDAACVTGREERELLRAEANRAGGLRNLAKVHRVASIFATAEGGPITAEHIRRASARLRDAAQAPEGL